MKRLTVLLIPALLLLSGCGAADEASGESSLPDYIASLSNDGYDCDLTQLNANMMYGQIYDMTYNYEPYLNMSVRVTGNFNYYQDPAGKEYFSVFIPDAAACCSQGIEFILDGNYTYPDDYPEVGEEITVTGIFNSYEEYHVPYCQLLNAQIVPTVSREEKNDEES